jgi:hypothetical protein
VGPVAAAAALVVAHVAAHRPHASPVRP